MFMIHGRISGHLAKRASEFAGAVLLALVALGSSSCNKKSGSPEWDSPGVRQPTAKEAAHAPAAAPKHPRVRIKDPAQSPAPPAAGPATNGLRFIAYNVENWLTMDRLVNRKPVSSSPKPAAEKQTVVSILVKNAPDVVGLCEIGEVKDLAEIQQSLKTAGLDLGYSHFTGGSDPVRHLGILSRFPITPSAKPATTEFQMKGQTFAINRGILDTSIKAHGKSYRFLGVHLKSKREIEGLDQEEMRIHEARLLRRHVDAILLADADARLIVYGDFNDTRPSKAFRTVTGNYTDPGYLTAIPFKDSRGDAWTHYWELHDIYTRFDYVMISRALKSEVDFPASHIIDDPAWIDASDHRPLLAILK
jgi:endonuclease/exonuclease/phosphatase family metal-dependent hydrolase